MIEIKGNALIFSDLHVGLAGNSEQRFKICIDIADEICESVRKNSITDVIFGGDFFHSRTSIDVNALNVGMSIVKKISSAARLHMIVGNHDIYMKNDSGINSVSLFEEIDNVKVYESATECEINGRKCLFVPWLSDISGYADSSFDMMIGHFEISSKYLMQSYIEEHSAKKRADGASSLIGSFTDKVRKGGSIYAGHIHSHKEFCVRGRNFAFIGSPYQQTLGEKDCECGWYVIREDGIQTFERSKSAPRHVQIKVSDILSGKADLRELDGNIVQKIYDVDVGCEDEIEINRRICAHSPYEEINAEYAVEIKRDDHIDVNDKNAEMICNNRLDYVKAYLNELGEEELKSKGIRVDILFPMMESYFAKASAEA